MLPVILLVEDNAAFREAVIDLMRNADFSVKAVGLTEDALEVLRTSPPDVIVLDLVMPRGTMQGIEFLAAVREVDAWKRIPIIILSAYQDVVNHDVTDRLGAAAVLGKPLSDVDLLPNTVRAALRQS